MTYPASDQLVPGAVLAGKYRIDRVLGAGGMGVVVAAHHVHLEERVAIKTLLPEMLAHSEAVERFLREARAAVKIKSEHVAHVSDVGTLENGAPYMVMEFLEGEDLSALVDKRGPLPVEQAVEFVLQACEALAEAHALGIVHRDLKPANLFCVRRADGLLAVKVLDFGISKMSPLGGSGPDMGMTKTTAVMGSPYYMSPEQMLSAKNADAQSDIWSLGAVLFELLSGVTPFSADTLPELVLKVSNTDAPDVGTRRSEVPAGLRAVVARALQRDRAKRYTNVAELAFELAEYGPAKRAQASAERASRVLEAAGLRTGSGQAGGVGAAASREPVSAGTMVTFEHTDRGAKKPSRKGYVLGLAALTLAGFAVFFVARGGAGEPEPAIAVQSSQSPATAELLPPEASASAVSASAVSASAVSASAEPPKSEPDVASPEPSAAPEAAPAPSSAPPPNVVKKRTALPAKTTPPVAPPKTTSPAASKPSKSKSSAFGGRL